MEKWIYAIAGGAFTLIVSLIGVVWWMLQRQIELRDKFQNDRIELTKEAFEDRLSLVKQEVDRRSSEVDTEVKTIRKRIHELVDRFSAVETGVKYGLFRKRLDDDG